MRAAHRFRLRLSLAGLAMLVMQAVPASDVRVIAWEDLLPADSSGQASDEGGGPAATGQWFLHDESSEEIPALPTYSVGVVEELNGVRVAIPGFIVPVEVADRGRVTEFLLVPYYGACIHYPPPPSNQIVHVTLPKPVEIGSLWAPVWVAGEIRTEMRESELGNASYSMRAEHMEDYE
ncbi:MAG: DUF3299 domain-containing protein [Pseudomonadota bacterium]